jgi:spore coat protein A
MDAAPGQDDVEIWTFDNRSGGWFHPIHVHLTDFKILDRNGQPPLPYEVGPKDVAYAGEGEVVRVIAKFGPRRGKYMMHCHNVIHEDHDMMTNFEVGTGGPDPVTAAPPKPVSQLPTTPLVKPPSTA